MANNSYSLDNNAPQFVENWAVRVRLKIDVLPPVGSTDDAGFNKSTQFSMQVANTEAGLLRNLAQVEFPIRMAHQEAKHHPARLGKQC